MNSVDKTINSESVYITLSGDISIKEARLLNESLLDIDKKSVVIDFTKVGYVSSVCICELIKARKTFPEVEFILFGCNDQVYNMLEITGVHVLFKIRQ